jgi:hypothetical protein
MRHCDNRGNPWIEDTFKEGRALELYAMGFGPAKIGIMLGVAASRVNKLLEASNVLRKGVTQRVGRTLSAQAHERLMREGLSRI